MNKKLAIFRVDGGICSQIHMCAVGRKYQDLGYQVKYDISWFDGGGKDMNGVFDRNYNMQEAFSTLKFEIATKEEVRFYKQNYDKTQSVIYNPLDFNPPAYFGGYWNNQAFFDYKEMFKQHFNPIDKHQIQELLNEVNTTNSCAVHIRRGDVSGISVYGIPPNPKYFIDSMNIIAKLDKDVRFYLFSDEPQWVQENIAPQINHPYTICNQNGSDKGYLDLYLISRCKHIISSHGSLGLYGKNLSIRDDGFLIMSKYREYYLKTYQNTILLSNNSIQKDLQKLQIQENLKNKNIRLINKARLKAYQYLKTKLQSKGLIYD